ncbi:MAG: hypothetical protein QM733_07445 [Ilumatobacteraceae bacterium]
MTGVHHVDGRNQGDEQFVEVDPPSNARAGVAYVGTLTASRPAVEEPQDKN